MLLSRMHGALFAAVAAVALLAVPSLAECEPRHRARARAAHRPLGRAARRPAGWIVDAAVGARQRPRSAPGPGARRRLDRAGHSGAPRRLDGRRDAGARRFADCCQADGRLAARRRSAARGRGAGDARHGSDPVRILIAWRAIEQQLWGERRRGCRHAHVRRSAQHAELAQLVLPGADLQPARLLGRRLRAVQHRRPRRDWIVHAQQRERQRPGLGQPGAGGGEPAARLPALRLRLSVRERLHRLGGARRGRRHACLDQRRVPGARRGARARTQPRPGARGGPALHERNAHTGLDGQLVHRHELRVRRSVRRDGRERLGAGHRAAADEHAAQAQAESPAGLRGAGRERVRHLPPGAHGDAQRLGGAAADSEAGRRQLLRRVPAADRHMGQPCAGDRRRLHPHRVTRGQRRAGVPERRHRADRHASGDAHLDRRADGCRSGLHGRDPRHPDSGHGAGRQRRNALDHASRCTSARDRRWRHSRHRRTRARHACAPDPRCAHDADAT